MGETGAGFDTAAGMGGATESEPDLIGNELGVGVET
jgi:hypothetical protein